MFTNTMFQRAAKAIRCLAVAALVAATVPAGFTAGFDGTAIAASNGRGGGGGGGGGGGSMSNPVLKCLGAECINVSEAQIPCTSAYCKEEEEERKNNISCDVRVCKIEDGRRNCRIEVSYDERICIKNQI